MLDEKYLRNHQHWNHSSYWLGKLMKKFILVLFLLLPLFAYGEFISPHGGGVNCTGITAGWAYQANGDNTCSFAALAGTGTVTSAGLNTDSTTSSIFANSTNVITGSPITSSGNMTLTLSTEHANYCLMGPTTGSAAAPAFRALVGADLPNPSASTLRRHSVYYIGLA